MIDIRVWCYFVPLESNERSDYTSKNAYASLYYQKLRYVIHRLRNVLPDERGFTGVKLWQKYYLCFTGGNLLTSALQEQGLMSNTQSFPSYNAMSNQWCRWWGEGRLLLRLQQEIENVPAREVLLWRFYNTSREQTTGIQGCGIINDWKGYITAYLLPSTQLVSG